MGFFTGIGNHERVFNSTFFVLYDFSKISKYFLILILILISNSNASFCLCLFPLSNKDNSDQSGKFIPPWIISVIVS